MWKKLNFSKAIRLMDTFVIEVQESDGKVEGTFEVDRDSVRVMKEDPQEIEFEARKGAKTYIFSVRLSKPLPVDVADQVFAIPWEEYDFEEKTEEQ